VERRAQVAHDVDFGFQTGNRQEWRTQMAHVVDLGFKMGASRKQRSQLSQGLVTQWILGTMNPGRNVGRRWPTLFILVSIGEAGGNMRRKCH